MCPALGDHAQAVAVAVEGKTQLRIRLAHGAAISSCRFSGLDGIGMMVGEIPVDFAIQLRHRAAQAAEQLGRGRAGDAVAAVDGDVHRSARASRRRRCAQVGFAHVGDVEYLPAPCAEFAAFHRAGAGAGCHRPRASPPASTIFRPLYSGGLWLPVTMTHAAAAEMVRGEIAHRRGRHADVDDVDARRAEALRQRARQRRPGQPAVAADRRPRLLPARARLRAQRPADGADDLRRERASTMPRMS